MTDLVKLLREAAMSWRTPDRLVCDRAADRIEMLERILRQLVCDCSADCKHYMEPIPSCMCFGAFPKEGKND